MSSDGKSSRSSQPIAIGDREPNCSACSNVIPQPCYLVLADDDVRYKPDFLRGLVDAQARDRSSAFSYFTHRVPGLSYGQGVDGFGIWSPNVSGIRSFAETHVDGTNLFFHDDLWISFFL